MQGFEKEKDMIPVNRMQTIITYSTLVIHLNKLRIANHSFYDRLYINELMWAKLNVE